MKLRLFASSLILGFLISMNLQAQPVKKHGNLSVKGIQLTDEHGNPVVLNGVSYGWSNWWSEFYNEKSVSWLAKDWKVSVIRAAMGIEPDGGYLEKPQWTKEKIETVIKAAIKNNIYVIIDWHCHNIRLPEAKEFFAEMATKYGKYPNVIYELYNEPVKDTWAQVKDYSIELIRIIRAIDPDNVILVGSPHWDQDINLAADEPITGFNNLMYTCHFYAATHGQSLRDKCDYALNKGVPVFISESAGMEASGNGPINYGEWHKWIDWCANKKISLITWSVSSKRETCSMIKQGVSPEGHWKESDLQESGVKTRELLRKQAEKDQ